MIKKKPIICRENQLHIIVYLLVLIIFILQMLNYTYTCIIFMKLKYQLLHNIVNLYNNTPL